MRSLYSLFSTIFQLLLPFIGLFSQKLKLFANGRKEVFSTLQTIFPISKPVFWFHCASLGEYEQAVPVIQAIKKKYTNSFVIITFFSPSGYEAKKNSKLADHIAYLPIDTKKNAKRFINLVKPEIAVFVKYEVWPNYFSVLKTRKIPILLISAVFRKDHIYFKKYGGFLKDSLSKATHIFTQDIESKDMLLANNVTQVIHVGDTRFDRVALQLEMNNKVDFLEKFVNNRFCIVIGSSWKEDEVIFMNTINRTSENICFIIAPHEIKPETIQRIKNTIQIPTITYSEQTNLEQLKDYKVFILDTIGYLSKAYYYADIAYVGGGMGTAGLHNILEPATFGIPIIIGKNFEKFHEAKQLRKLGGLFSVTTAEEFMEIIKKLTIDVKFRNQTGMIAGHFVNSNTGATSIIMNYIADVNIKT
ncbi:3-deoxy-D-manno-octulosonic acid transferase [Aquimarina sp. ERC-38]|uniref:3-deoxy-D-manno-octulosonic acid transferase n=1 Tax=Aquimarina sp. ERC-38 TaxID=2949996 RepID=UPI0022476407|nr:glycosyltransferase N-terminal domain-containing protein [Aquimarina sp. ERC-38]UZO81018.1 3-deoxy-D-manno-octulosonic acid transferase [Aquimarina sp. ERC-38]